MKLEPVLVLLAVLMLFFTGCLFVSEHFFPSDGQIFQVVSGLLTGIAGAFLMRVKPPGKTEEPTIPPPGGTVTTSTTATASVAAKHEQE